MAQAVTTPVILIVRKHNEKDYFMDANNCRSLYTYVSQYGPSTMLRSRIYTKEDIITDGVFAERMPLLTYLILSPDKIASDESLSGVMTSSCMIPRIVQRLIRDIVSAERVVHTMTPNQHLLPNHQTPTADHQSTRINSHETLISNSEGQFKFAIISSLASFLELRKGPYHCQSNLIKVTLQIIEDPYDSIPLQPALQPPNYYYGGSLYTWDERLATVQDRLGFMIDTGYQAEGARISLRIKLYKIQLLNHPFMNIEEKYTLQIKLLFNKYKQSFQNHFLEYLYYRILSLLDKLIIKSNIEVKESDSYHFEDRQELNELKLLYHDFLESLSTLYETVMTTRDHTKRICALWQKIKNTRKIQGFSVTKVNLKARPLLRKDVPPVRNHLNSDKDTANADESKTTGVEPDTLLESDVDNREWVRRLRSRMNGLPETLQKIQRILVTADHQDRGIDLEQLAALSASLGAGPPMATASNAGPDASRGQNGSLPSADVGETEAEHRAHQKQMESIQEVLSGLRKEEAHRSRLQGEVLRMASELCKDDGGLIPDAVLRLNNDGDVTADSKAPKREQQRRRMISSLRFRGKIIVNGHRVAVAPIVKLIPFQWLLNLNCTYDIKVLQQPKDIQFVLECFSSRYQFFPIELSRISLPLPGTIPTPSVSRDGKPTAYSHTYIPAYKNIPNWIRFSSDRLFSEFETLESSRSLCRVEAACLHLVEYETTFDGRPKIGPTGSKIEDLALAAAPNCGNSSISYMPVIMKRGVDHGEEGENTGLITRKVGKGGVRERRYQPHLTNHQDLNFMEERDFQILLPSLDLLDRNDPRNENVLYSRTMAGKNILELSKLTLKQRGQLIGPGERYCIEFEYSNRMKLLILRRQKPFLFVEPIPISEDIIKQSRMYRALLTKFIPPNQSTSLEPDEKASRSPQLLPLISEQEEENEEERKQSTFFFDNNSRKLKVSEFLLRVRESYASITRNAKQKIYTTSSVISDPIQLREDAMANREGSDPFAMIFPPSKRSLYPQMRDRIPQLAEVEYCDMLIQIVSAKNIPLRDVTTGRRLSASQGVNRSRQTGINTRPQRRRSRNKSSEMFGDDDLNVDDGGVARVDEDVGETQQLIGEDADSDRMQSINDRKRSRIFVEIKFQDHVVRTTCVDGGTGLWKQSLRLPFRPPQDDFSQSNLLSISDEVSFNLFDEVLSSPQSNTYNANEDDDDGLRLKYTQKKYLGGFHIPFVTICSQGKIDGVFRLNCPIFNFGYQDKHPQGTGHTIDSSQNLSTIQLQRDLFGSNIFNYFLKSNSSAAQQQQQLSESTAFLDNGSNSEFDWFCVTPARPSIRFMATLDPLLMPPASKRQDISPSQAFTSATVVPQDRFLSNYAQTWLRDLQRYSRYTQSRTYRIFGLTSDGFGVFIPRFLTPSKPPDNFSSRRACLHLISMIPFISDSQAALSEVDLWCTNAQVWDILAGDEEEHAVLLFNFLYYMLLLKDLNIQQENEASILERMRKLTGSETVSQSIFLVLGRAAPEGDTVYILLRKTNPSQPRNATAPKNDVNYSSDNFLLINPTSGYVYGAADPQCPLLEIACIATPHNIWANIQPKDKPFEMNFNIHNTRFWRPFFGVRFPFPSQGLATIQRDIKLSPTTDTLAKEISDSVRDAIKLNFRRWRIKRKCFVTQVHQECSVEIQRLLYRLEDWKRHGEGKGAGVKGRDDQTLNEDTNESGSNMDSGIQQNVTSHTNAILRVQNEIKTRLKNVLRTRILRGFPLNLPFTDVDDVVQKVKSYCVHENRNQDVQFVVSVRAFPLVQGLVSLWIFLGTLEGTASNTGVEFGV